jgi:hypothetical protein
LFLTFKVHKVCKVQLAPQALLDQLALKVLKAQLVQQDQQARQVLSLAQLAQLDHKAMQVVQEL